ncbi:response regulator transcription factor [Aureliella helgolandensis]|uniref:Transcriptional regulatory protein DegU n=1 Tax=Aureliella helgolandensis TaxID=2527968 RepID=A0A518GE18_9BACT|nr:response regulator transcription factor [Aureliella helgolandensis]QDV26842.1 Transcriptional regulatory protein DegU [Aureliella helgolandensis]
MTTTQATNQVLVFHRNGLFRDCLVNYIKTARDDEAIAIDHAQIAQIGEELFNSADVVLLDLNLPGVLPTEIIGRVQTSSSPAKIIVLVPDDHGSLAECLACGVHGCVLERASLDELNLAIDRVLEGSGFCSGDFAATMFAEFSRIAQSPAWQVPTAISACRLTGREQEVIGLLAKAKSNKQIAKELSVSLYTVKNHVHNILEKLSVETRMEAVELARQENWVSRF